MKKLILIALLFVAGFAQAQEQTMETLGIIRQEVDTIFCEQDTITKLFLLVQKTTTDNGTAFPNTRVDTTLFMNGNCPADSLEVKRQLYRDAIEIQNRAARFADLAFENVRRSVPAFSIVRTVYTDFTGEDVFRESENRFWNDYQGRYVIINTSTGSRVMATMKRLGAREVYRLEVDEGENGAGTRYAILPLSQKSFIIRQWEGNDYTMYLDSGIDRAKPVFRDLGFLTGPGSIIIVKL